MLDPAIEADLRGLFSQIRLREGAEPIGFDHPGLVRQVGYGADGFYLDDDADRDLAALVDRIAQSALTVGGRHSEAVDRMLMHACEVALDHGADAALTWLESALGSGSRRWTVGERTSAFFIAPSLRVGRCMLYQAGAVVDVLGAGGHIAEQLADQMPGRIITTEVDAFDAESAYLRASDAIEEARAILLLLSSRVKPIPAGKHFIVTDEGGWTLTHADESHAPSFYVQRVDESGDLWPGYRELSTAARKSTEARTPWERRTLGSARWYLQARTTRFPSAALVAGMSALEAVLIRDERSYKGAAMAQRLVTHNARVFGVEDARLTTWFEDLYRDGRNPATHEARFYEDEREVARLLGLVEAAVHWAVTHLSDDHNQSSTPCTTFDEAHRLPHS